MRRSIFLFLFAALFANSICFAEEIKLTTIIPAAGKDKVVIAQTPYTRAIHWNGWTTATASGDTWYQAVALGTDSTLMMSDIKTFFGETRNITVLLCGIDQIFFDDTTTVTPNDRVVKNGRYMIYINPVGVDRPLEVFNREYFIDFTSEFGDMEYLPIGCNFVMPLNSGQTKVFCNYYIYSSVNQPDTDIVARFYIYGYVTE